MSNVYDPSQRPAWSTRWSYTYFLRSRRIEGPTRPNDGVTVTTVSVDDIVNTVLLVPLRVTVPAVAVTEYVYRGLQLVRVNTPRLVYEKVGLGGVNPLPRNPLAANKDRLMGYAYFVSDANTVNVAAAVFTMSYTYESIPLAFPTVAGVPNCHLGVMVVLSILSTETK